MKAKGSWELVWVAIALSSVITLLIIVVAREDQDPRAQSELKSQRIAIVNNMRMALAAASEQQNLAVMSPTEQTSKTCVEQAKIALESFENYRLELEKLAPKRVDESELQLLNRVGETFREFLTVSEQLSDLALQSSNRRAMDLAFGPGMKLLQSMDKEFAQIAARHEDIPSKANLEILKTLSDVRFSGMRTQLLLLPHIAEPSDQKMDEFEKMIAEEDQAMTKGLESLQSLLNSTAEIERIQSLLSEFQVIEAQILKLSRENSGIRSVAMALNEKRKAMLTCQDALANLEKSIQSEVIETAIPKGRSQ